MTYKTRYYKITIFADHFLLAQVIDRSRGRAAQVIDRSRGRARGLYQWAQERIAPQINLKPLNPFTHLLKRTKVGVNPGSVNGARIYL